MKTLDCYLIRRFFAWFAAFLVGFAGIYMLTDLVQRLDTLVDRGMSASAIGFFYLYSMPYSVVVTIPASALLAAVFTVGSLARTNELVAMKASGISLYRILWPLIRSGLLLSLFTLIFGEVVVPASSVRRRSTRVQTSRSDYRRVREADVYLGASGGRIVYVGEYDVADEIARRVAIDHYAGHRLVEKVTADAMHWGETGWWLFSGSVRTFGTEVERLEPFDQRGPVDLGLGPDDFSHAKRRPNEMGYFELRAYVEHLRRIGADPTRWLVDLALKIAYPIANVIIVLVGAPLASGRSTSGKAVGITIAFGVFFAFLSLIHISRALGWHHVLGPALAAWLPNIVFAALGLVLLWRAHK